TSGVPTALGLRAAMSSMFSWALQVGLLDDVNPVVGVLRPEQPKPRERTLSNAELATVWKTVGGDSDYGKVIRLLILCAARRNEIGAMQWSEFDLDKGTWTLPSSRSKNGLAHTLPVIALMRSIIEAVPVRAGNDYLFGTKAGFAGWVRGKKRLDGRL